MDAAQLKQLVARRPCPCSCRCHPRRRHGLDGRLFHRCAGRKRHRPGRHRVEFERSTARLRARGYAVLEASAVERLPLYIDGADEIDYDGYMIRAAVPP